MIKLGERESITLGSSVSSPLVSSYRGEHGVVLATFETYGHRIGIRVRPRISWEKATSAPPLTQE